MCEGALPGCGRDLVRCAPTAGLVSARHDDVRARLGQCLCRGSADPPAAASHQSGTATQVEAVHHGPMERPRISFMISVVPPKTISGPVSRRDHGQYEPRRPRAVVEYRVPGHHVGAEIFVGEVPAGIRIRVVGGVKT
jgi:hypothetical protein